MVYDESSECILPEEAAAGGAPKPPSSPPAASDAWLMCSAERRKTGQACSRCGQAAQNQRGIGPVLAVDTR